MKLFIVAIYESLSMDKHCSSWQWPLNYGYQKFYEIETCGQIHKTFFCIICTAIGILPYVLKKKFIWLKPVANFIKLYWHNLGHFWHIALSSDLGYAARGVNDAEKSFINLKPVINFIKLLLHNFCCYWHIDISSD